MATSNPRLNDYVKFLNALNKAELDAVKLAAGPPIDPSMMGGAPGGGAPMDPAMMGGAPMDPSMMGGAPMDPSMMGGAPMDPGMAMGIPGGIDPAALGLIAPNAEEDKAREDADKILLEKSLDVSNKALELAQAQNAKSKSSWDLWKQPKSQSPT